MMILTRWPWQAAQGTTAHLAETPALVDLLCAERADPNARDGALDTPLHRAVTRGDAEVSAALRGGSLRTAENTAISNDDLMIHNYYRSMLKT